MYISVRGCKNRVIGISISHVIITREPQTDQIQPVNTHTTENASLLFLIMHSPSTHFKLNIIILISIIIIIIVLYRRSTRLSFFFFLSVSLSLSLAYPSLLFISLYHCHCHSFFFVAWLFYFPRFFSHARFSNRTEARPEFEYVERLVWNVIK